MANEISTVVFPGLIGGVHRLLTGKDAQSACGIPAPRYGCDDEHVCYGGRPASSVECLACQMVTLVKGDLPEASWPQAVEAWEAMEEACIAGCDPEGPVYHSLGCKLGQHMAGLRL